MSCHDWLRWGACKVNQLFSHVHLNWAPLALSHLQIDMVGVPQPPSYKKAIWHNMLLVQHGQIKNSRWHEISFCAGVSGHSWTKSERRLSNCARRDRIPGQKSLNAYPGLQEHKNSHVSVSQWRKESQFSFSNKSAFVLTEMTRQQLGAFTRSKRDGDRSHLTPGNWQLIRISY